MLTREEQLLVERKSRFHEMHVSGRQKAVDYAMNLAEYVLVFAQGFLMVKGVRPVLESLSRLKLAE